MFKRNRIEINNARKALEYYKEIPINFVDADLIRAIEIAHKLKLYAYDAYFLESALRLKIPLLSLDNDLINAAKKLEIEIIEV